nr:hypothetical protein [Rubrobacter marinus]
MEAAPSSPAARRPRSSGETLPGGVRRILFVELLGGLGDVLISLGAIQALSRSYPEARLTVLTFPPGGELLEGNDHVDEVVHAEPGRARGAVEEQLARGVWDLVVSDTSYDGIDDLIRGSGVPRRAATNLWRSPPPDERVGERFLNLLRSDGLISDGSVAPPGSGSRPKSAPPPPRSLGARPAARLPPPDAGMEVKRWPEGNWGALGASLRERLGAGIVVPVGSDEGQAGRVAGLAGGRSCPAARSASSPPPSPTRTSPSARTPARRASPRPSASRPSRSSAPPGTAATASPRPTPTCRATPPAPSATSRTSPGSRAGTPAPAPWRRRPGAPAWRTYRWRASSRRPSRS